MIGSDRFEPQNELEVELVRAAHEPAFRDAFLRELLDADVFLALIPSDGQVVVGDDGQASVAPHQRLELGAVEEDGRNLFPFYSSPERAQEHVRADHFIAADKVHALLLRHPEAEFVLNPGSDYRVELSRSDVEAMLRGDLTAH